MNYDEARQRQADGRWDWTTANRRRGTFADGYCAGWQEWDEAGAFRVGMPLSYLREEHEREEGPLRHKYHTDGHATREEAERCYYEYCIDHLRECGPWAPAQACEYPGCETIANMGLENRGYGGLGLKLLCDTHRTPECYREIEPFTPGWRSMHS